MRLDRLFSAAVWGGPALAQLAGIAIAPAAALCFIASFAPSVTLKRCRRYLGGVTTGIVAFALILAGIRPGGGASDRDSGCRLPLARRASAAAGADRARWRPHRGKQRIP